MPREKTVISKTNDIVIDQKIIHNHYIKHYFNSRKYTNMLVRRNTTEVQYSSSAPKCASWTLLKEEEYSESTQNHDLGSLDNNLSRIRRYKLFCRCWTGGWGTCCGNGWKGRWCEQWSRSTSFTWTRSLLGRSGRLTQNIKFVNYGTLFTNVLACRFVFHTSSRIGGIAGPAFWRPAAVIVSTHDNEATVGGYHGFQGATRSLKIIVFHQVFAGNQRGNSAIFWSTKLKQLTKSCFEQGKSDAKSKNIHCLINSSCELVS
jgi:hypothetical protein